MFGEGAAGGHSDPLHAARLIEVLDCMGIGRCECLAQSPHLLAIVGL